MKNRGKNKSVYNLVQCMYIYIIFYLSNYSDYYFYFNLSKYLYKYFYLSTVFGYSTHLC